MVIVGFSGYQEFLEVQTHIWVCGAEQKESTTGSAPV